MPLQNLLACLTREHQAVTAFIQLLEEESQALANRAAPDAIGDISQRKTLATEELGALAQSRDAELATLGFAGGNIGAGMAAAAHPELGPAWQDLLDAAASARELNERNGRLIDLHLRFNRESRNALRAAAGATLYGANGRQPAGIGHLGAVRRA